MHELHRLARAGKCWALPATAPIPRGEEPPAPTSLHPPDLPLQLLQANRGLCFVRADSDELPEVAAEVYRNVADGCGQPAGIWKDVKPPEGVASVDTDYPISQLYLGGALAETCQEEYHKVPRKSMQEKLSAMVAKAGRSVVIPSGLVRSFDPVTGWLKKEKG